MDRLINDLEKTYGKLKTTTKTIHCITNPISINDMANVILFLNQSPIMADSPREVAEISSKASSLLINLGNLQDYRMDAIRASLSAASKAKIPITLDLVGVSASSLRLDFAKEILSDYKFSLIKGNYSEIYSLEKGHTTTAGVDSKDHDYLDLVERSKILGEKYATKILASGKKDIVHEDSRTYILENGDKRLKKLTGTGCILGGICASTLAIEDSLESVILATSIENISSEEIDPDLGLFSFKTGFLDKISLLTIEIIKERIKYERY